MVMPRIQRRCGSPVTGAAPCPDCRHQDGGSIPSHHTPRAEAGTLTRQCWPAATPLMESGSSPTLCLGIGTGMCPGRVQPGYSSWEEEAAPAPPQSCSPPPPTPQHLASVCLMIHGNTCIASHCKYSYCYHNKMLEIDKNSNTLQNYLGNNIYFLEKNLKCKTFLDTLFRLSLILLCP